jgi:hypothetical protein
MNINEDFFYSAEDLPVLQNRLYGSREEAGDCSLGCVRLSRDIKTGVITNFAFKPELVLYDENYNNEQGLSKAFQNHLNIVADLIRSKFTEPDILEVGCGKGRFLTYLREREFEARGIDPTYEGQDALVERRFFDADCGISSNGVVVRHVLEHIVDPLGFLCGIRDANGGRGRIYIEVPCFEWICSNRAWYDIFYEHVNYFTASDFMRFFAEPPSIIRTFSGQYLSVFADLSSLRNKDDLTIDQTEVIELPCFTDEIARSIVRLKERCEAHSGPVVVWGAASKGVIYSLHMIRAGITIDFVVDIDPAKQGKYLPVTGLPVLSPSRLTREEGPAALVLIMNENYLEEIREMIPDFHECYAV